MYNFLSKHPEFGIGSGVLSKIIFDFTYFLTDESFIKIVSNIGIYAGTLVALLTAIIKIKDLAKQYQKK